MTKRSVWKISLLCILAACTAAGLALLHQSSGKGAAVLDAYAAEETVVQDGLSFSLSTDGNYYILDGFADDATDEQKKSVPIPDAIGDIPVTEVKESAFENEATVTSISIGANMYTYGAKAFGGLSGLEKIYYGCTVQYSSSDKGSIGASDYPFDGMGSGTENGVTITVSKNATSFPFYMFCSGSSAKLYKLIFEDNSNFGFFGSYAFSNLTASSSGGVYITDLSAWCGSSFTNDVSNPLETGLDLYLNNELLEDLVIPEDVTEVYDYAFYGCKSLRSLNIHKNVLSIGTGAFQTCASLEYIYFNAERCTVSTNAFASIGTETSGVTLVIGKDVFSIEPSAFAGLNSKTGNDTVVVEEGSILNRIETQAFCSSGFTSIALPGSVAYIGTMAFSDTGITADTLYLENPYDWYTTNSSSSTYDPDKAAEGIITYTNANGRTSYYASAREVLRGYVDETSDAADFSVSLWWYERYEWTASITGTTLSGETVSGSYSNHDRITEPGEYSITMVNSTASDTLTFQIYIQDAVTTDPTCTEDGLEQYLVSYTVDGETYELDPCNIILPATGHTYINKPSWTWEWDSTAGSYAAAAKFTCSVCGEATTEAATVTVTDNGTTYTAKLVFEDEIYTATLHEHSYSVTATSWSDDHVSCTLTLTCAGADGGNCTEPSRTEYASVSVSVTEPSCTEDGSKVYTATYNGTVAATYTETLEATGHTYGYPIWSWTMDEETSTLTAAATFYCTEWDDEKIITAEITQEATDFATIYHATVTGPDGETYTSSESVAHLFNVSWTWTGATDGYTAVVTLTCQICGRSFEHDATVTQVSHRDATCTVAGYTRYEATFTLGSGDEAVTYTENKTDVIDALGHVYVSQVIAPTCTEDGYTLYTCSRCGDTYTDTPTDALGHDYQYSSATWTWYETYSIAKVEISCSRCDDVITDYVQTTYAVTKDPTCTETGTGTYTATYYYEDANGETQSISSTKEEAVPANGHTYEQGEFSWTGDSTNGYTAATLTFTCSVCNDAQTVDATIIVREEDPTTYVARAVFEGEIYRDSKHVHVYAISGTEWSEDGEGMSCTITFTCIGTDCDESYTKAATVTSETTAATCTEDGQTVYTATYEDETVDAKIVVIEATGHTYGSPSWEWTQAEDSSYTATATFFCEYGDDAVVVTADITKETDEEKSIYTATAYDPNHPDEDTYKYTANTNVEHILDASWKWEETTDEDGNVSYTVTLTLTCQICHNDFVHTSTSGDVTVTQVYHRDAACEVTGYTRYEATYIYKATGEADLTYTDTRVDTETALEHNYTSETTDATCTEGGYTTHTCSLCGDVYTDSETDALGHTYSYNEATWSWAGTSSAEAVLKCSVCEYEYKTGYLDSTSATTKSATCTEEGELTYTVTYEYGENGEFISATKTEPIPATGHTYVAGAEVWSWEADTENGGYIATLAFTCSVCQDVRTETGAVLLGDNGTTYYATVIFEGETYTDSYHVHVYEITDTEWSEDNSSCTITFTCMGRTCEETYTDNAEISSRTTDPTCTEDGYILYIATYDGKTVSTATTKIDQTGHTYGEPTWSWDRDEDGNLIASAAFQCIKWDDEQIIEATITQEPTAFATIYHAEVTSPDGITYYKERSVAHVFEVEWTWSEDGSHTASVKLTCQICGRSYTYDATVTQMNHRDVSCTADGFTLYEAVYVHGEGDEETMYTNLHADIVEALGHDYTSVVTVPTCTEKGYTTYTCSRCGDTYTGDETAAAGHSYSEDSIIWMWAGNSAAELIITCDTCGDTAVMQYIAATDEVTTEAACTEDGERTYTVTYKYGTDGESSISDSRTEVIPATGHSYVKADSFVWTDDYKASLTFTCEYCQDEQTVDASVVRSDSRTTYTAEATFEGITYTETLHVHSYEVIIVVWGTDDEGNATCSVTLRCIGEYCYHYEETVDAEVSYETTDATCLEDGATVYTATYDGLVAATQTEVLPATGHTYGTPVWSWSKAEDGTYSAVAIFICESDDSEIELEASVTSVEEDSDTVYTATVEFNGQTYTDKTSDHEHVYTITWEWAEDFSSATLTLSCIDGDTDESYTATVEITAHVAAGCETDGYTIYEASCTVGDGEDAVTYLDVRETVLAAHGHSYASTVWDATCTEEGYTLHRCMLCGDIYHTEITDATGIHAGVLSRINVDETAMEVYAACICSVCGQDYTDECCIVVTDYYGETYTIAFVNGVASYASVAYPKSIVITGMEGETIESVDITPVTPAAEPDNPNTDEPEPDVPVEPGIQDDGDKPAETEESGGLAGWVIAIIVVVCVVVVAAAVVVIIFAVRRKKAKSAGTSDSGKK